MSVDEFLVDLKGFHDLDSEKQVEIRNAIEANANAAKGKRASAPISDGSPAKKSKSESSSGVQAVEGDEIFALYKSKNIDELKDILRWNSQVLKGTKV